MKRTGFTIVELLASTAIISVMVFMLVSMTDGASRTWRNGQTKVEQFRSARTAFDGVTRRLSRATLNTYWDYEYAEDDTKKVGAPIAYIRQSELRFRAGSMDRLAPGGTSYRPTHGVFFQAPLGAVDNEEFNSMGRLLNTIGYFLEVGDDREFIPDPLVPVVKPRIRSRLLEFRKPAEQLSVFQLKPGFADDSWFAQAIDKKDRPVRMLAENILALVILPRLSEADELARRKAGKKALSPKFDYDSTQTSNHRPALNPPDPEINPHNQLPPVVMVTMFAIDEVSGERLQSIAGSDPRLGLDTETLFQEAASLEAKGTGDTDAKGDLAAFSAQLLEKRLNYRLFSTSVALRGARWSRGQTR